MTETHRDERPEKPARLTIISEIETATICDLQEAFACGLTTAANLVRCYAARIKAYDQAGPRLNAVRQMNPDGLAIAEALDTNRSIIARPLEGISILLKDNIATGDAQPTTAGSLALANAYAHSDATVVRLLREAGAVILGKANLTEFANVLTVGMPGGYSSLGGQVRNPYAPQINAEGIPILSPGGSSSGSAVAVAAGFATAAIGTETSGSLLSPANQNGVVTVKPTVGLISRAGIVPITRCQDTVGPLTRSVRDAAILLNVLAVSDPEDDATLHLQRPTDYTSVLDKDGLRGARIGIPTDPNSPASDVYYGPLAPPAAAVMREVGAVLEGLGATLVHANIPTTDWAKDSDVWTSILKLYPNGLTRYQLEQRPILYLAELKHGLNAYLRDWAKGTSIRTMADIIAFNAANADRVLRFGQAVFLAAERSCDDADTITHITERCMDIRARHARTIDTYMDLLRLDAVLFPGHAGAGLAAKAGYPSVHVPAGMVGGVGATSIPYYPLGVTFMGRAWSEPVLLRLAYAFEQATKARRMPQSVPRIVPDLV